MNRPHHLTLDEDRGCSRRLEYVAFEWFIPLLTLALGVVYSVAGMGRIMHAIREVVVGHQSR